MRVGVLQTWLSGRYLPFWEAYLRELEVEVVRPLGESVDLPMPEAARKLMGEVFSLKNQGVDYLLLPDLQLGVEPRKGNPSPWLVGLEATLARLVPGLPSTLTVPAELSPDLAGFAAEVGQSLTRNPMLARRAMERTKKALTPAFKAPVQGGNNLVGVVAQPVLLEPGTLRPLREALDEAGLSLFVPDKSPQELREEGGKLELGLELPTDLEAAGMHRYLSRLGKVKAILHLHDDEYAPLPTPLRKLVTRFPPGKPAKLVELDQDWAAIADEFRGLLTGSGQP